MRVDFAFGVPNRFRSSCFLIDKLYQAGRQLIVFHGDPRALAHFDRLLWGFQPTAFIPHCLADDPHAAHSPIVLCHEAKQIEAAQSVLQQAWLFNLDPAIPPVLPHSRRIIEVVSTQPDCRTQGRNRWRTYQNQGFQLKARELNPQELE